MKSSHFSYLVVSLLLTGLWACTSTPENSGWKKSQMNAFSASSECSEPVISKGDTLTYRIKDSCATKFISQYQEFLGELKDTLNTINSGGGFTSTADQQLVWGAKVDLRELREILIRSNMNDSLFIMQGIMSNNKTEMIFVLKSTDDNTVQYFDFTMPCPTACPTISE